MGLREKILDFRILCSLVPGEERTTSAEAVGAKGAIGAGSNCKCPVAAMVVSTPRYWGA